MDYILDVTMRKPRNGRRKKKHFCNEMDDMEKGYTNHMYDSSDFDQVKNNGHCYVCHGEGHTKDRHKEGSKRNRRARGIRSRNHRSGTT
jgi:hypothetical protein